jgi:phosphatidate cytidylyltransferase
MKLSERALQQRILTGSVLVTAILASLWWGFPAFALLFGILAQVGLFEFYRMAVPRERRREYIASMLAGGILYTGMALSASGMLDHGWMVLMIPFCAFFLLIELYLNRDQPFAHVGLTFLGLIYIVLPFGLLSYLLFLPDEQYNPQLVLGIFVFLWTSDSAAYVVGRSMGRTKLFERISPNKTIEGSVGGILASLILGFWVMPIWCPSLTAAQWLVVAALVSVAGVYGDLLESLLKRSFDRKDSGSLLPGHGGVLDRFDSLILSAPLVYAYLRLVHWG